MSLSDLPSEMLVQIIKRVSRSENGSLKALALVNQKFHGLVQTPGVFGNVKRLIINFAVARPPCKLLPDIYPSKDNELSIGNYSEYTAFLCHLRDTNCLAGLDTMSLVEDPETYVDDVEPRPNLIDLHFYETFLGHSSLRVIGLDLGLINPDIETEELLLSLVNSLPQLEVLILHLECDMAALFWEGHAMETLLLGLYCNRKSSSLKNLVFNGSGWNFVASLLPLFVPPIPEQYKPKFKVSIDVDYKKAKDMGKSYALRSFEKYLF